MKMIHSLKTKPEYYEAVQRCEKRFEVRKNDRDFRVCDYLALNEFDGEYTGRSMLVRVTYILDDKEYCKDGYVIMNIQPCKVDGMSGYELFGGDRAW